jgi:peptide/nickel transport system permease protein
MTALPAGLARRRARSRRRPRASSSLYFVLAIVIIVAATGAALMASVLAPADPASVDLGATLAGPGTVGHALGTDTAGRDSLSRLLDGARLSLLTPLIVITAATALGSLIGIVCGWAGGIVDGILSRVVDFLFAFPSLLVAMLAVALFGRGQLAPTIGLIIAYTPYAARLVRNLVMQEKARPYVEAYRLQGYASHTIAVRMLLPNISPTMIAQAALGFGYVLVDLAALSYLGLGVQPPTADWGVMVADGQEALIQGVIWPVLFPCLAIVAVVVAINIVSDHIGEKLTGGAVA